MGYDAGKRVKGRKIHALVDTEGLPLRVVVHSAGMQDRDGAALVLDAHPRPLPLARTRLGRRRLRRPAGQGGRRQPSRSCDGDRPPQRRCQKGFEVQPRRWVVERTFSWFGRNRRLAKDYENLTDAVIAFVHLAAIQLLIRRLARA